MRSTGFPGHVVYCARYVAALAAARMSFSDDAYGAIDLDALLRRRRHRREPACGRSRRDQAQRGWYEGNRAEFYDFGLVNHRRKRNAAGATIREPDIAYVNPMYFFFDAAGKPMFSKPLFDRRTGTWSMKGGQNMLDPNPVDSPERRRRQELLLAALLAAARAARSATPVATTATTTSGRSSTSWPTTPPTPACGKSCTSRPRPATCPTRSRAGRRWRRPSTPRRSPSPAR